MKDYKVCKGCGKKHGLYAIDELLYDDTDDCPECQFVYDEDDTAGEYCETTRTTYNTVEFCEEYQRKNRKNIDWGNALKIERIGGADHYPLHKATFSINGNTVEFEDHVAKKEVKARVIAMWQEKYKI